MTYLSGFQIVHRYAYVVVPAHGEPQIVFPTEACMASTVRRSSTRYPPRPSRRAHRADGA